MEYTSSLIPNRITIHENKNEYIVTFSCATDITQLLASNSGQRNLDMEYENKFGRMPEPFALDDSDISFKDENGNIRLDLLKEFIENQNESYKKADSSIYRAKSNIYDLMQSNYWDFFVTITVNPNSPFWDGVDITDVRQVQYKVTDRIRNLNNRRDRKIKYVLIPEYQKNGNVHFHGVISGIDTEELTIALNNQEYMKDENGNILIDENGDKVPNKFYKTPLVRQGNQVYNFDKFSDIGYNDFEIIRDMSRVGSYCTKYVTKDLFDRSSEYGAHLYICSKGLERKKQVYKRNTDTFRYLTDSEIKAIDENAYIVRTKYSTKVTFSKKYLHSMDALRVFCDGLGGETLSNNLAVSSSGIRQDLIQSATQRQLEMLGIKKYNPVTGEIELDPCRSSFRNLRSSQVKDTDTDKQLSLGLFG